jgi:hypothetical protein
MENSQDRGVRQRIKSPLLYQQGPSTNSGVCFASLNARTGKGSACGSETAGSGVEEELVCAGCGHATADHLTPGSECVAIVGEGLDGDADFCPCSRFVDPGAVVEPARAERFPGRVCAAPGGVPADDDGAHCDLWESGEAGPCGAECALAVRR